MHSHKLRIFFKSNIHITLVIIIFLFVNLFILGFHQDIVWDSSVYIGMGKYIFSFGNSGLWEPIRPLTLPLILGFFWKIGLEPLIYGKILMLLFSVGVVILTYVLSNHMFNKWIGVIASIIIAFSALMLTVSREILVEVPALFFLLLGFYFYLRNKNYAAGLCFGLAFLTKFPAMLFFIVIMGIEFVKLFSFNKKEFLLRLQPLFKITMTFILIVLPYLVFNHIYYHDFAFPLKSAKNVIDNVVGCTFLYLKPAYYYLPLILKDNPLHIFFIIGAFSILLGKKQKYKINKAQILVYVALFFLYFTLLKCKTDRYPIIVLPFVSMITSHGLVLTFEKIYKKKIYKNCKYWILIAILVVVSLISINYTNNHRGNATQRIDIEFFIYASSKISGEILTTTPQIAVFTDSKLEPMYYYSSDKLFYYTKYINQHKERIAYVLVNTDDIPCHPRDIECANNTENFVKFLKNNLKIIKRGKTSNGEYFIFSPQ